MTKIGQNISYFEPPYAIICDIPVPKTAGVSIQVLTNRTVSKDRWWTKFEISKAFKIRDWELAKETVGRFHYNNPRIISWSDAVIILNQQRELLNV